ncbi:hypothetical protein HHL23_22170 [Chryseobacterium sp. RP-3-3]|uniref:Uncharacterized protein n=1 Tax=Chryseobacterium antibioticum TaxID=2728847 RepID=A0A7Y0AS27_9FLAO|nr:hypothetical protein [Chryseobacterium antibioticum]NML72461.1 hypothetical protein [Chryseobacterium antibioticum]
MKRYLYTTLFIFIIAAEALSQVGINTSVIQDGVALQVESSNKGMLFPRVALSSRVSTSPLAATIPTGTMVFNTAAANSFPNTVTPGLHWWDAVEGQWTNFSTNTNTVMVKYTNSESTTNYNTTTWQNVKLFGNKIINESSAIYLVNNTNQSVTVNRSGLYSISSLLSFDRLNGSNAQVRLSLSARVYVNGVAVGTEQAISPGFSASINGDRGLFSHAFTEYLELADGDVVTVKIRRTVGTYRGLYGQSPVQFLQNGDSSIAILRIR